MHISVENLQNQPSNTENDPWHSEASKNRVVCEVWNQPQITYQIQSGLKAPLYPDKVVVLLRL